MYLTKEYYKNNVSICDRLSDIISVIERNRAVLLLNNICLLVSMFYFLVIRCHVFSIRVQ